jgi:hypothetical protein
MQFSSRQHSDYFRWNQAVFNPMKMNDSVDAMNGAEVGTAGVPPAVLQ